VPSLAELPNQTLPEMSSTTRHQNPHGGEDKGPVASVLDAILRRMRDDAILRRVRDGATLRRVRDG